MQGAPINWKTMHIKDIRFTAYYAAMSGTVN